MMKYFVFALLVVLVWASAAVEAGVIGGCCGGAVVGVPAIGIGAPVGIGGIGLTKGGLLLG